MNEITDKTNKSEVISAAVECIDDLQLKLQRYKEQQIVLGGIAAVLLLLTILWHRLQLNTLSYWSELRKQLADVKPFILLEKLESWELS